MTDVPPPPTVMYRIPVEFQVPGTTQRSAATVLAAVLNDTAGVADRLAAYAGVPTAERQAAHPWAFVDRALTGIDTGVRGTLSGLREGTVMPEPAEEPAPQRVHAATIVWSGHPGANPTVVLAETEAMAWHLAALDVVEALTEDGEAFPGAGAFLQQHPETMVYAGRPREWLAALAEATPFPAVAVAAAEVRPDPAERHTTGPEGPTMGAPVTAPVSAGSVSVGPLARQLRERMHALAPTGDLEPVSARRDLPIPGMG